MNNCIIFLFRAGGATWCLLTIIIYCYELVTAKNIIHSFTICILCRTQHHAMLPRPQGGDYEFKLAFEIIPRWEGWDNQNIFWCQLPTGTWHWHKDDRMKTGNWCGETGALMGSLTIPTVLTINAFSSCAICNFVLWKSFCFVCDARNWSQMPPVWVYTMLGFIFLLRQIIFLTPVIRISALAN